MKIYVSICLALVFALAAFAQDAPKPDRWRGLVLDESTPEQVLQALGKPKTDKVGVLPVIHPNWMSKSIRSKTWRVLHYESIEGFSDVKLGFDSNSKLVLIQLEPKKITAQAFLSAYPSLEFRFADEVLSPSDFNSPRNDEKTTKLGVFYLLIGLTNKVFVFSGVGNAYGGVMSDLFGSAANRKAGRSVAGDVKIIQLVSRTLENKDSVDILK